MVRMVRSLLLSVVATLVGGIYAWPGAAEADFSIIQPALGSRVSELRPTVAVSKVDGATNYLIEVSPEPTFFDRNTLTYVASNEGISTAPMDGTIQSLRLAGLNQKYRRYSGSLSSTQWRVPHNLTAVLSAPYGKRIVPCRNWLKHFSDIVVEGSADPLVALTEYVSFGLSNEGSGSGYYNAYEILARDMGVCGNTAELLTAFSAAQGLATKILSLKAPDQGHVVASTRRADGKWFLLDGLYNIIVEGDGNTLIDRVVRDAEFLDFPAFDGISASYRHFFRSTNYAYQTETTAGGIRYSDKEIEGGTVKFADLIFDCGPEMSVEIEKQKRTRVANIFFVRAAYYRDGKWSPWAYSYFNFVPNLADGESLQDNMREIWRQGLLVPSQFLGGEIRQFAGGKVVGSAAEQGYSPDNVVNADGQAWLSRPWTAGETEKRIGYDAGEGKTLGANGMFIGWVTPASTPRRFRIEGSLDGQTWHVVQKGSVSYAAAEPNYRIDYVSFAGEREYRYWSLVADRADLETSLAIESLLPVAPASKTLKN